MLAARAAADRRARKRGTVMAIFVVVVLTAAGAIGYYGYQESQSGEEAVTEPTTFEEDFPSIRGGPRAEMQMDEIEQALDPPEFVSGVEDTTPIAGHRGLDSELFSITNTVTKYESAAPDADWTSRLFTEYEIDGDHLAAWRLNGPMFNVVATGDWVYSASSSSELIERRPRPAAGREPGADLPLAGVVTPQIVLPDEARAVSTSQSAPTDVVQVYVVDLAAFRAAAPDVADRWIATWPTPTVIEQLAPDGPVQTAKADMEPLQHSDSLHRVGHHEPAPFTEPIGTGTFVAYQTGPDGSVITARIVSYELDLRVEFLERRRIRGGYVPVVADVEWN